MYSVYRLICPIDNEVRYIGITQHLHQRYRQHLYTYDNKEKREWVIYLRDINLKPILEIICECKGKREALKIERLMINYLIKYNIKNYNFDPKSASLGNKSRHRLNNKANDTLFINNLA